MSVLRGHLLLSVTMAPRYFVTSSMTSSPALVPHISPRFRSSNSVTIWTALANLPRVVSSAAISTRCSRLESPPRPSAPRSTCIAVATPSAPTCADTTKESIDVWADIEVVEWVGLVWQSKKRSAAQGSKSTSQLIVSARARGPGADRQTDRHVHNPTSVPTHPPTYLPCRGGGRRCTARSP